MLLVPMTDSEFERFSKRSVADYAAEKVRSGEWSESNLSLRPRRPFDHCYQMDVVLSTIGSWYCALAHNRQLLDRCGTRHKYALINPLLTFTTSTSTPNTGGKVMQSRR